jgi:hypothetical protein
MNLKKILILFLFCDFCFADEQRKDINNEIIRMYNHANDSYLIKKKKFNNGQTTAGDCISPAALLERPMRSYMENEEFISLGGDIAKSYQTLNSMVFNSETPLENQIIYSIAAKTLSRTRYIDYMKFTATNNINHETSELLTRSIFFSVLSHENLWADKNDTRLIDTAEILLGKLPEQHQFTNFLKAVIAHEVRYSNKYGEITNDLGAEVSLPMDEKNAPTGAEAIQNIDVKKSHKSSWIIGLTISMIFLWFMIKRMKVK